MKIYIGHSGSFNYKGELYKPLMESLLSTKYELVFPHKTSSEPINSKESIKSCDLMVAEVSYPSTGLGIEIGWANNHDIPVIYIYKKGSTVSNALKIISTFFIEYSDEEELVAKLIEATANYSR